MKRIKESKTLLLVIAIIIPLLFIHFSNSSLVTAAYYGTVNQDGTVTVEGTTNGVEGVKVELLEDLVVIATDYTNANGTYEFTWTKVRFKLYSVRWDYIGCFDESEAVFASSSEHTQDLTIEGRIALFMWASDVGNQSMIEDEYGDYLEEELYFSDILYHEDPNNWKDSIEDLDDLETSESLVFIHLFGHGVPYNGTDQEYGGETQLSISYNPVRYLYSGDFADELENLESENIIVIVDSCSSGDFVYEYQLKSSRNSEDIFIMAATQYNYTYNATYEHQAAQWFGESFEYYDESEDFNGAYGATFTHYFFEGLADGKTDYEAFSYSYEATYNYSYTYFYYEPLDIHLEQNATYEDQLTTTWFG